MSWPSRAAQARLVVTLAGLLKSKQGINLPGADLKVKALTDKDLADLDWTARNPVEFVGLSFVRSAEDVRWLRRELVARDISPMIVAKIEKPQAVADFDAILAETDAVMVARGDLGVEMDVARVPAIQKRIIAACHRARVPVITATQMLASMETSSRPTRAEAADVFNAVLDGTDAVMLSGETAVGQYPVETVSTMSRIVSEAENLLSSASHGRLDPGGPLLKPGWITETTEVVGRGRRDGLPPIEGQARGGRHALGQDGHRPLEAALRRPHARPDRRGRPGPQDGPPLGRDADPRRPQLTDGSQSLATAVEWARERGLVSSGDRVVLVRGLIPGNAVHNAVLVQEVD